MEDAQVVVLMSGGIDSSAVIALLNGCTKATGVFVDYGQPSAQSEWLAAQEIARYYRIAICKVGLGFPLVSHNGEFVGRNALFILAAVNMIETRPLRIALGIHALSDYYDTTPLFLAYMQRLLDGYFHGLVTLYTPFVANTKSEVIRFAQDRGLPLGSTYSCEIQNSPACGQCPSCQDRIDVDTE